jgi:hypothetical protein
MTFICDHENDKLVYKIATNGCKMFFRQCQNCGRFTTSAISHTKLSEEDKDKSEQENESLKTEYQSRSVVKDFYVSVQLNGFFKEGYISKWDYYSLNRILENIGVKND